MMAIYFFAQTNEVLKNVYEQIQKTGIERIETLLVQVSYEKGKKIRESLILAELIHSLLVGEVYKTIYHHRQFKPAEREKLVMGRIEILIDSSLALSSSK